MSAPDFSVVIVNWNGREFLRACLESLRENARDASVEPIVVDNGSSDGSVEMARALWPEALVLPQGRNLGYVPANNVGLRHASGRYTMYLNNDAALAPGCLRILREFLDARPDVGAASGQILNPDGSDQGVARRFPSIANGLFGRRSVLTRWFPGNRFSRRYMVGRHHEGEAPFEVDILSAACLVFRTDVARALGGMDEAFVLYWVDAEMLGRMRRQTGLRTWCVPAAKIVHHEGHGGSTRTFRQRCRMTIAFNRDSYLAYVSWHQLGPLDPRRLFAAAALSVRAALLMGIQLLRPARATSSGGRN